MDNCIKPRHLGIKEKVSVIGTVLFFLSFTPYFFLIYIGIEGINFGMQGIIHFYGLTAVIIGFIFLCILGIIPLCLIFQIIFGKKYIAQHDKLRKATKILITVLVVTLILISPISCGVNKIRVMTEPSRITEYLADKFGEETINQIIDKIWSNEYLRYAAKNTYYSFVININVLGAKKAKS